MRKYIRSLVLLISPFLFMIVVNETLRPLIKENPYSYKSITAINSTDKIQDKCTWNCHNNTYYCMKHHVKFLKPYFSFTNKVYFGTINLLKNTGNYGAANIIFLVVLFPLVIWLFIIKSLNIQDKIEHFKKQQQ